MAENEQPQAAPETTPETPVAAPERPTTDPHAAARQHIAEQQLQGLQSQIAAVQQQLGSVSQELIRRNQAEMEAQLATLPPAERAEKKAEMVSQQLAYLQGQLQRQQVGQAQESREQYFQRRSRELEQEINGEQGLDGDHRVKIADVPEDILAAGEKPTAAWMRSEAENRKARASRKRADADEQIEDDDNSVGKQVRRALADAGVTGPVGARAAVTTPVELSDFKKLANQERSPRDLPQGTRLKQLKEMRERAYAEAGLTAPGR